MIFPSYECRFVPVSYLFIVFCPVQGSVSQCPAPASYQSAPPADGKGEQQVSFAEPLAAPEPKTQISFEQIYIPRADSKDHLSEDQSMQCTNCPAKFYSQTEMNMHYISAHYIGGTSLAQPTVLYQCIKCNRR